MRKPLFRRAIATVSAVAIASSMTAMPVSAFADDTGALATGTHVTAAACRAAGPAAEILGMDSVEESGQFVDMQNGVPQYNWTYPKYYLAADPNYKGTDANNVTLASPYLYNLAHQVGNVPTATTTDGVVTLSPTTYLRAAYNPSRNGGGAGPDAALEAYGSDATDDAVWNLLPDVIIGDGDNVDYSTRKPNVTGYSPTGVDYSFSDFSALIDEMYSIAAVADAKVTSTGKSLRFGSATAIAKKYEMYIRGTKGYILSQLGTGAKKKVALVSDYDEDTEMFTLVGSNDGQDGTASTNRYLEACQGVATNISGTASTEVNATTLATADLVLIGGQNGMSNEPSLREAAIDAVGISKVYSVMNNGTQGAMYGVVMNSVENAQNIGRILGCLYPEYVDQDDWIGYYYESFYHVPSGSLANAMYNALNGVRNYDGATGGEYAWGLNELSTTYSAATVEDKLKIGCTWINNNITSGTLVLTNNITSADLQ